MSIADKLRMIGGIGYIYRKDSFEGKSRPDRIGIWNVEKGRHYASCTSCGAVNEFDNHIGGMLYFDRRELYAHVQSCIVCHRCGSHFFIFLKDWAAAPTEGHKKILRTIRRVLGTHLSFGYFGRGASSSDDVAVVTTTATQVHLSRPRWPSLSKFTLLVYPKGTGRLTYECSDKETALRKMAEFLRRED